MASSLSTLVVLGLVVAVRLDALVKAYHERVVLLLDKVVEEKLRVNVMRDDEAAFQQADKVSEMIVKLIRFKDPRATYVVFT
jgi:hypothetical protein